MLNQSQIEALEVESMTKQEVLRIARNLQAGYSKDLQGAPRSWADVGEAEQQAWIRAVRRAAKMFGATQSGHKERTPSM